MKQFFLHLFSLFILIGITQSIFAQVPDTLWTKTYGGSQFDRGYSVLQTSDNGYIIAGETSSFGAGLSDVWVIRTDSDGDTLWTKSYGSAGGYESARSIRQTSDGGFILAGSVFTTFSNALVIRINADGDTLWTKSFGGFDTDLANDVLQTPDGGFLICGETRSYHQSGFGSSIWLIRTNDAGDTLWTKIYGGGSYQRGNSINPTSDGGFIITGSYNNGGSISAEVWLLRIDASGDTLWTKTFGGDGSQEGSVVFQTPDGGYIVYGSTGFGNIRLIRTDQSCDSLWSKTIPFYVAEKSNSLDLTSDGGFIITGSDMGDALIIRIDESGNILWTKTIGGKGSDNANAVRQVSDEGYIVCGSTDSYSAGGEDVWVIRFESEEPDDDPPIGVIREFTNVRPAFNKFKGVAAGDWNGDDISEIAVMQGCILKLYDPVTKELHLAGDFDQDGDVDGSDFLICDNGELAKGVSVNLIGFVNFGGILHSVVSTSVVDGNDLVIWQSGIIINAESKEIVYSEEGSIVGILELPNGNTVILTYIEQDNIYKIIGEPTGNSSNKNGNKKILSHQIQDEYQLELKFESDPGLQLAYDPDLFDPPGDTDLDNDGYLDLSILKMEGGQPSGMIVRGGDNFDILWDFTFPYEHKENILKGFHGFADADGNGIKEAIFGDNLAITLDGTVHTIAENFVTLDVNDIDNDGFEDIIGINTVDSSIVIYGTKTSTSATDNYEADIHFRLFQNYPNPFNPSTAISYSVSQPGEVDLTIFNSLGQVVRRLVNETKPAGEYTLTWDGRNNTGQLVSSGAYFYRLIVGKFIQTRRMLLLK